MAESVTIEQLFCPTFPGAGAAGPTEWNDPSRMSLCRH